MMTTAQNLEQIISARDVLRTTAVNFGIALSDAQLAELAEAFGGIINRGAVYEDIKEGESYSIQRGYYTGAHDAYNVGDVVDHGGVLYESQIDGNTTVPGSDERYWKLYSA